MMPATQTLLRITAASSRHVAVENQPLHKDVKKYGYGNADAARDHAGLISL